MMNIVLIGFASCGKSAAAAALSGRTGLACVDLDRVIEERYERTHGRRVPCREIFRSAGADGFAALENDALSSLSDMRESILSTGGRTPMLEENRPLLKSLGRVVYLRCGVGTVLERMRGKGIPVSMGSSPEGAAAEWSRRAPVYAEVADVVIDNDTLTPEETAEAIAEKLQIQVPLLNVIPAPSGGRAAAVMSPGGTDII